MKLSEASHARQEKHPERILQFGTGVLLRGLCDFLIDKANNDGFFKGSAVVVKSMPGGIEVFNAQDNLYTVCVRGIKSGENISKNVVCETISRVLAASTQWEEILKTAENPDMDVVISNTTEVGLKYVKETLDGVPTSFPGKLTAWLQRRFNAGLPGVIIIPTELVVDNGDVLKDLILRQIEDQNLSSEFKNWIENETDFCNSLVDRIVPGKPAKDELQEIYKELGYEDQLLTKSEVYALWAIQGNEDVKKRLSFEQADERVVVEKDITQYRELKLRMLNAPHTLMCGLCFLADFETVKEALNNDIIEKFISNLMLTELAPAVSSKVDPKVVQRYGREIIDRFRNPYLDHKWHSITFQYTMKIQMRTIPLLTRYYEVFGNVPHYFARGMAAYLLFMKAVKEENGQYFGEHNGENYILNDDQAAWYFEAWKCGDAKELAKKALSNTDFWGMDLCTLEGFEDAVATHLCNMNMLGVKEVVSALNVFA
ncbi:tagaturonate reductase [uncultured Arcticibacterium sp.]|uniref:tagaturonate reductase n=1 Tax=uncultured Arcticibacterium sp. TaxID=2173042 RepID=UPI0030F74323